MCWDNQRTFLSWILALFVLNFCAISANPGYLLTMPNAMQVGMPEKICIAFHGVHHFDVNLNMDFRDSRNGTSLHLESHKFHRGKGSCINVTIPNTVTESTSLVVIRGSTEFNARRRHFNQDIADYTFSDNQTVLLRRNSGATFIQTDKPIYNPGQTVKFRILTVKRDLKPLTGNIKEVWVQNPKDVRIKQWLDTPTQSGLGDFEMQMTPEPILGEWKINAKVQEKVTTLTFKIEEYVLPKFKVTISAPSYILVNDETFSAEICAKYTYGKPVKGSLHAVACVDQPYITEKRCASEKTKIDGCTTVTFDGLRIRLGRLGYSLVLAKMKFTVTVEEDQTGISQTEVSTSTKLQLEPLVLELSEHSPDFYKPKLPYHGKGRVVKPDKSPAEGELVLMMAYSADNQLKYMRNFTTDDNGFFEFSLPPFDDGAVEVSLRAAVPMNNYPSEPGRFSPQKPRAHLTVKKWYSRSDSFLQIEPVGQPLECGSRMTVEVIYTTPQQTEYKFHYIAISRGVVVDSGVKKHKVGVRRIRGSGGEQGSAGWREFPESRNVRLTPSAEPTTAYAKSQYVAQFMLHLNVTTEMSPGVQLIVYYIRDDRETVADHREFRVARCVDNKVGLHLAEGKESVRPGETTDIKITAEPGSICSLGVVDEGVHILGGDNQLNLAAVFESLKMYNLQKTKESRFPEQSYCERQARKLFPGQPVHPNSYVPYSRHYDTIHAFNLFGVKVLTDLDVETIPCDIRPMNFMKYSIAMDGVLDRARAKARILADLDSSTVMDLSNTIEEATDTTTQKVELRDFFPETWLWDLHVVGEKGEVKFEKEVPHTITTWVGNSFCTNPDSGLGVSPPDSLTVFQPFFASFNLPYSVIRGERVPVSVSVFNYLSECLVIKLTLKKENWFEMVGSQAVTYVCVCGSEKQTQTYLIKPTELGSLNLTVEAESVSEAGICSNILGINNEYHGIKDAVRRQLIVEPEGKEVDYAKSLFVCPTGTNEESDTLELALPSEGLVPGSARGYFQVIGDVMGPALSGLDKLLRMPTGCGEQNMLKFAPNIFIMQYLTGTNQVHAEIKGKAKKFMETGYQRELNYRHDDGSYSAFGKNDAHGSTWLTAFVTKSFAEARSFVFIDQKDLDKSIRWFTDRQLENGCFRELGRIIHKSMKGGLASSEGSPPTLTAYVLIAMLESGMDKEDNTIKDAVLCLKAQTVDDTYSIALMTYAMSLYDVAAPFRVQLMDKLDRRAIFEGGKQYWTGSSETSRSGAADGWTVFEHPAASADVEMTAYALLAKLANQGADVVAKALPIVKWLTSQRNEMGGFSSTQDTVVGLQALARYATLVYGKNTDIDVAVQGREVQETISIDNTNSLVLHLRSVSVPNTFTVRTNGTGCVFIQASARYNINNMTNGKDAAFSLTVNPRRVMEGSDQCRYRQLEMCARYSSADGVSNMAVVSVKMVTGWIPVKLSLHELIKDKTLGLKRFEVDKNWVNFYFDELTGDYKCFVMEVEQDLEIGDLKPALVQVYDYYDKQKSADASYGIKTTCGTKEEIPFGRNEAAGGNMLEQRRVISTFPIDMIKKVNPCPACASSAPENSDLREMFCAATKAYRVDVQRRKRFPLKARKELRQNPGDNINISIRYTIPEGCQCSALDGSGKVLLLMNTTDIQNIQRKKQTNRMRGSLQLAQDVTVIPMGQTHRPMERKLRRFGRNCDRN